MYQASAPRFANILRNLSAILEKAEAHCAAKKIEPTALTSYRLFPDMFTFTRQGGRWRGSVAPEYYGLLMFAQAAPPGSRLLQLTGNLGHVRAWATRAPDGAIRVVLINEYTAQSRTVEVRIPGAHGAATLKRLLGKGITDSTGVTLGGQTFGTATSTGTLSGHSSAAMVQKSAAGYVVKLPRASAAMLTITPPPPA